MHSIRLDEMNRMAILFYQLEKNIFTLHFTRYGINTEAQLRECLARLNTVTQSRHTCKMFMFVLFYIFYNQHTSFQWFELLPFGLKATLSLNCCFKSNPINWIDFSSRPINRIVNQTNHFYLSVSKQWCFIVVIFFLF